MPNWKDGQAYDRSRILEAAGRARTRRQRRRAIDLYRRVLLVEPHNPELHARLAPLLADVHQDFDAWQSYRAVARAHEREGHIDAAIAVYREAARRLPREVGAWQAAAKLLIRADRKREAVSALLQAGRHFRACDMPAQAIALLRQARQLEGSNFEVLFELARQLARHAQRHEAWQLLDGLAARSPGKRLRRVRAEQLRQRPGVASFCRWLAAFAGRGGGRNEAPASSGRRIPASGARVHAARLR